MKNQDALARAGVVTVRGLASGFAQAIETGSHQFRADEPVALGGRAYSATPVHRTLTSEVDIRPPQP